MGNLTTRLAEEVAPKGAEDGEDQKIYWSWDQDQILSAAESDLTYAAESAKDATMTILSGAASSLFCWLDARNALPSSSASSSCNVSSSLVGMDQRWQLLAHLDRLEKERIIFRHVAIWRQGLWMGVVDHHTLVYEYFCDRRLRSLQIEWGKDGLFFQDGFEDPCPTGDVLSRKMCRISAAQAKEQLQELSGKNYDIVKWNCQQFCSKIFDQIPEVFAGGGSGSFGA